MAGNEATRRELLKGSMAMAGALIAASGSAAAAPAPASGGGRKVSAAVVRIPVIVPQTRDALADVRRRNTEAALAAIETAMREPVKPRLIVFPVLQLVSGHRALSGLPVSDVAVDLTAAPLDQTVFAPLVDACRRHNIYVATSTQEKTERIPGRFFHTGFVMGPEGLVLRSPKTQAKSAPDISYIRDLKAEYLAAFGPDSILPVAKTPIGTLGCYIEAELEIPEASRMLVARGAEILIHPSVEDEATPWMALKQATAYQNQVFVLTGASSRAIKKNDPTGGWNGGASTIFGPDGKLLAAKEGHDEGIASAILDLDTIAPARAKIGPRTTPSKIIYGDS